MSLKEIDCVEWREITGVGYAWTKAEASGGCGLAKNKIVEEKGLAHGVAQARGSHGRTACRGDKRRKKGRGQNKDKTSWIDLEVKDSVPEEVRLRRGRKREGWGESVLK